MSDKKEGFTFYSPNMDINMQPISPREGEMGIVNLYVHVVFEWSDSIVADVDEFDNPIEYKSGWLMKVLPETMVYNGEKFISVAQTMKEK
jgi:hypothetical protein